VLAEDRFAEKYTNQAKGCFMSISWKGVFPAVTTQVRSDLSIDLADTQRVVDDLIRDGVNGVIALGTVGENNSLEFDEKVSVLSAVHEVVAGRVPVLTGVSEYDTRRAVRFARAAEGVGIDGLMLLPPMVYVPKPHELAAHFRGVARSTGLPIMLYNNPPAYRTVVDTGVLRVLADQSNIVAIKESAPDTRRITDIRNAFGNRFVLFAGLDDVALESLFLGAQGWVSGLTNAFPKESVALFAALERGDYPKALEIYRWFMPLLHLDADHDLVQSIKLAEQVMGRGSERVLPPRYLLEGERRTQVIAMVEAAAANRPILGL
jgi:1-pyrroline-4-hydroxy-2-carboxylate deaminase